MICEEVLVFCETKLGTDGRTRRQIKPEVLRIRSLTNSSTGHQLAYLYISSAFLYSRKCLKNWLHPIECQILFCVMILKMFPAVAVTEHYILPNFGIIILNISQNIVIVEYQEGLSSLLCNIKRLIMLKLFAQQIQKYYWCCHIRA